MAVLVMDRKAPPTESLTKLQPPKDLTLTPIHHQQYHLVPIDNGHCSQGILLAEHARNQARKIVLDEVLFLRQTGTIRVYAIPEVQISAQNGLYLCTTPTQRLLPFPSMFPYKFCELDESEFLRLHRLFQDGSEYVTALESALEIIARQTDCRIQQGKLVTPKGYADQASVWTRYSLKFHC